MIAEAERKIGLLGGECTGKSTLATRLATAVPACVVADGVRQFVVHHGRPPAAAEQLEVMRDQVRAVAEQSAGCPVGVVVADPAPLMVAIYSVLYFDDESLLAEGAADASTYDLLLWFAPDIPWDPDPGQRDGPGFRDRADRILRDAVDSRLAGVPVVAVRGSIETRLSLALRAWQTLGSR